MKAFSMFGAVVLAAMAVACGESYDAESASKGGAMTVHGTVSSKLEVDNARAVAIGTDGRTFWAYLDQDREFTLQLPVGQSYRVIVANQRSGGGQQTIGHLVLSGADGRTEWLGANSAIDVNLGTLRIGTSSSTKIACADKCGGGGDDYEDDDGKEADHDDDYPCKEGGKSGGDGYGGKEGSDSDKGGSGDTGKGGDSDKEAKDAEKDPDVCDVCTDKASDKELEPSKKPGSACADKDKDKHADADNPKKYGDKKACPKGGSDSKSSGDKSADSKSTDTGSKDAPAPSKDGSDTKSAGDDAGGKSEGSKCNASTECKSTCSCVASSCAVKK